MQHTVDSAGRCVPQVSPTWEAPGRPASCLRYAATSAVFGREEARQRRGQGLCVGAGPANKHQRPFPIYNLGLWTVVDHFCGSFDDSRTRSSSEPAQKV